MSTLYRERGLSSDTTIFPGFGIEQALDALKVEWIARRRSVRRVAIVGPGLDFTDKREGYDFYPQQTIQPFAVIDSLLRLGLARQPDLRVTTFDLSPRINHHLEAARSGRGRRCLPPAVAAEQRALQMDASSSSRTGSGSATESVRRRARAPRRRCRGRFKVRAVRVRPAVVALDRPAGPEHRPRSGWNCRQPTSRFDLIVATNVLVYYDVFEQALALVNVAKMLRPGGFLLTNTALPLLPRMPMALVGYTDVGYTERPEADRIFWWERE